MAVEEALEGGAVASAVQVALEGGPVASEVQVAVVGAIEWNTLEFWVLSRVWLSSGSAHR